MWLLSSNGDLFNHKSLWLRPDSDHLLGRTSGRAAAGELVRFINHKSVSRKHALIHVSAAKLGSSARLHERCEVTITDTSKTGTYVDGEKVCQGSRVLGKRNGEKREWTIRLGSYEQILKLEWMEVVLTFTNLSKASKAKGDPLQSHRNRLEGSGIKLVTEYVANRTTHVIGTKRNTPPALQALLQGRWVLSYGFVDAVAQAVAKVGGNTEGEPATSPLEEDFESSWPREEEHLLPAGKEPNPRPNEFLKPNSERAELFSGFVFIFLSQQQFDLLMPVITSGGGKALIWDVENGKSKVDDLVSYVKELAGTKGNADFRLSQYSGNGGIVVVRLGEKDDPWVTNFLTSVEIRLEQRSVEQNQFLDAILTLNASELRKPLRHATPSLDVNTPVESSQQGTLRTHLNGRTSATPAARAENEQEQPIPSSPEHPMAPRPARPKARRIVTKPRFSGFDDFEPSQFPRPGSESPEPEPSQAASAQVMEIDESSQPTHTRQSSRKRPVPSDEPQNERDMMDAMLQGQAAMKRRKTTQAQNGEAHSTPEFEARATTAANKASKKPSKQIDIRAELSARRKLEEEARLRDEESLRAAMDGLDMKNVKAKVETYEPAPRQPLTRTNCLDIANAQSDRWNPAWNGRKNFKRFRRQGTHNDGPRLQRVIVPLEEVPRKDRGLGDDYWLESISTTRSKAKSQSQNQSQAGPAGFVGEDDDPARFRRRLQNSRREDEEAAQAEETLPDEVAGRARDSRILSAPRGTAGTSQTLGTETQRRAVGKRPAPVGGREGPAQKKARQVIVLEDEEEDALRFRRRRRA